MISLPLPPKIIQKSKTRSVFEIEGLYPGYGITIGNALRRVLLSSLEGSAVTEVKIKGVSHEFSAIPGVLEDVIMIILNLKKLRFRIHEGDIQKAELSVKGEKKVKGSDFKISPQMELASPDIHLATITDKNTELNIEITVERGIGYEPRDQRKVKREDGRVQTKAEIGVIAMDAVFTPIINTSFYVENMRVGEKTNFDKLSVDVETDGTITPEDAFYQACGIIISHFSLISEKKIEKWREDEVGAVEDIEKTTVEELKLSTRTLNALINNKIKTLSSVLKKSEKQLSEMEGMGDKAISEIKRKIKKLGLELMGE